MAKKTAKSAKKKTARVAKTIKAPFPLKRILVPIDFSDYSKNVLKFAVPFAHHFNAELLLLYVVEPIYYPADFSFGQVGIPDMEQDLEETAKRELDELIKTHIGKRVESQTIIRTGKPFLETINTAKEETIDLIMIATHGHTGVEHLLFGSTAEKVVRKAPCPVLVVR
jgi:nucleotide-binding universal stress UspA family protein